MRREGSRAEQQHDLWLVQVPLSGVRLEPWLLLTNWPVTDAESAVRIFRMNRQRSGVEHAFKFTKECLGWEDVQLLDLAGIRTLVALAWVTAEEFLRVYVDEHGALPPRMAALLGNWSRPKLRVNVSHKNS